LVGGGKLEEVAVGDLFGRADPGGEVGGVLRVWEEGEASVQGAFEAEQKGAPLDDGESVGGRLGEDADESKFGDGASSKAGSGVRLHPGGEPRVEFVIKESQGDEGVDIEQEERGGFGSAGGHRCGLRESWQGFLRLPWW
jgi:hypothetical protein